MKCDEDQQIRSFSKLIFTLGIVGFFVYRVTVEFANANVCTVAERSGIMKTK